GRARDRLRGRRRRARRGLHHPQRVQPRRGPRGRLRGGRGGGARRRGRRRRTAHGRARARRLMRVTVTGATGTIGGALVDALTSRGDHVTVLSRNPAPAGHALEATAVGWPNPKAGPPPRALCAAVTR